nr:GerAB/ArcD/ProY family transporter [Haloplasma contractile]
MAVFKNDKLVGWLSQDESKGSCHITGCTKSSVISFSLEEEQENTKEGNSKSNKDAEKVHSESNNTITLVNITSLGVYTATNSTFPIVKAVRKINIANFIQRVDPIIVLLLILGSFFKVTVYAYTASSAIKDCFNLKHHRRAVLPVSVLLALGGVLVAESLIQHIERGLYFVPKYIHPPMELIIPLVVIIVIYLKRLIIRKH